MRTFCTYFDSAYLSRGLALYESLSVHAADFVLYVLCLDDEVYKYLKKRAWQSLVPITLQEVERWESRLAKAKMNRSVIEYYFTLSPIFPKYILHRFSPSEVTYLDADLYFFSSPEPLFNEMSSSSVQIIPHRFSAYNRSKEKFGVFNVQYLTFRNDEVGLSCIDRWSEQCLDWCYDRLEGQKYADQKYLDEWPKLYPEVCVSEIVGAGLAPWNQSQYAIHRDADGHWLVNDMPVIFYHFHNYVRLNKSLFSSGVGAYRFGPNRKNIKELYKQYSTQLDLIDDQVGSLQPKGPRQPLRSRRHVAAKRWARAIMSGDVFLS